MRHRITYFGRPGSSFSPEQVIVTADSLTVHNLDAAKEHRITLGLTELPKEVMTMFPPKSITDEPQ